MIDLTEPQTESTILKLDTIDAYHKLYGIETLHPLASVIDFRNVHKVHDHLRLRYGFYALWLKHGEQCSIRYGRNKYDYSDGTVVSFPPVR